MKKTSLHLIKVKNQNFYETTTGMQWYKGKNYILITLKNEKQKHVFASVMSNSLFRYIYTHNALECENSGPIWGEMTLKNSVFKN